MLTLENRAHKKPSGWSGCSVSVALTTIMSLGGGVAATAQETKAPFVQTRTAIPVIEVVDQSGAVIAGSEIRLVNESTHEEFTGKTNDAGQFPITGIHSGKFTLTIRQTGFATLRIENFEPGDHKKFRLTLAVAMRGEVVSLRSIETQPSELPKSVSPLGEHVTDATGAVISGAHVTLTNTRTGEISSGLTDSAGILRLPVSVTDQYKLVVVSRGFRTLTREHVALPAAISLAVELSNMNMGVVVLEDRHTPIHRFFENLWHKL